MMNSQPVSGLIPDDDELAAGLGAGHHDPRPEVRPAECAKITHGGAGGAGWEASLLTEQPMATPQAVKSRPKVTP